MKALICLFTGSLLLAAFPNTAPAQGTYGAEAYAQRQQEEERWRKVSAQLEELISTQEVLRKRLSTLEEENRALRTEVTKAGNAGVSPEEFQRVIKEIANKLKEVDDKRVADNKTILEQVKQLVREIKPGAATTQATVTKATSTVPDVSDPLPGAQEGFTHVMQEGETISAVVQAFKAQGVKTSMKAVLAANPKVNPNRIKPGTEIFIPKPK